MRVSVVSTIFSLGVILLVVTIAGVTQAGPTTDSVAYQGSLTDASNNPVADGPRDLTVSIWTDSIGGTMLFSEIRVVTTTKGLFSTCIGCGSSSFPDIFDGSTLFLQLQLAGQAPMSPRTRLRSVPYSVSSASVNASATHGSSVARALIRANSAVNFVPEVFNDLNIDLDGNGTADIGAVTDVVGDSASLRLNGLPPGTPYIGNIAMSASGRGALGQLSGHHGSTTGTIRMQATGDSVVSMVGFDGNGNGVYESSISSVDPNRGGQNYDAEWMCQTDKNDDGTPDLSAEISTTQDSASLRLNGLPPGTPYIGNFAVSASGGGAHSTLSGHNGSTTGTIRMAATPDSVVTTDGCGTDGEQRLFCTTDSVVREITFTDNGPLGTNLMKAKEKANRTKCSNNLRQVGQSVSHEIDQSCDLTGATFKAIQTKGTGQSGMVRMDASDSASVSVSYDANGDLVPEFSLSGRTDDSSSQLSVSAQAADGGNHTDGWNVLQMQTGTRETLKTYFETGDIPTQDQVVNASGSTFRAINTKGTGAVVRVAMEATDSATTVVATDADGDGHADSRANIAATMNGNVVIGCLRDKNNDGVADVTAVTEVTGDSATFRLNGLPPGVFPSETVAMTATQGGVHMEVGAATCDGSTWTNASDRNLKENFKTVDGEALLEKIDELPIQQWNYRSQSSEVVHIGPTAQDFKGLFGVGESDKTISTIDPSGIALAAIKQLNKQNHELQEQTHTLADQNKALLEQNAQLKKQLDVIAAKVEKLTFGK